MSGDDDREAKERKEMIKYGMLESDVYPMLRETKLWVSEDSVSQWAYYQCLKIRDEGKEYDLELINMITTSKWAYMFCQHIEDHPDMRKRIVDSEWALNYCTQIRDDEEVLERVTDPVDAQLYFEYKRDRLESKVKVFGSTDARVSAEHKLKKMFEQIAEKEKKDVEQVGQEKSKLRSVKNLISKFKRGKKS